MSCPYPNCIATPAPGQYACKTHWFALPKEIQNKIWRGFKGSWKIWLEADKAAKAYWDKQLLKINAEKQRRPSNEEI